MAKRPFLPYFALVVPMPRDAQLVPSLCLNPGYRDVVTPSANELRELAPSWVRVLLYAKHQDMATGQNSELDWLIDRVMEASPNLKILVLLNPESLGEHAPPSSSARLNGYNTRASKLAQRVAHYYRARIHAMEVWNEPDVQQISPEDYASLLKATYREVKAVNPDLPVISAGICCGEAFDYLRRVVAAAPDAYDFAGWHAFAERADGYPFAGWGFGELRNSLNQARAIAKRPLWITEIGAQLDWNWGTISPLTGAAEYMERAFAIMRGLGRSRVAEAFWFT